MSVIDDFISAFYKRYDVRLRKEGNNELIGVFRFQIGPMTYMADIKIVLSDKGIENVCVEGICADKIDKEIEDSLDTLSNTISRYTGMDPIAAENFAYALVDWYFANMTQNRQKIEQYKHMQDMFQQALSNPEILRRTQEVAKLFAVKESIRILYDMANDVYKSLSK